MRVYYLLTKRIRTQLTWWTMVSILVAVCQVSGADETFESSSYGLGAMPFLRFPVSGAAAGLGGAVSAWSENLTGVQYNPAVLDAADSLSYHVSGSYTIMTLDRKLFGARACASLGEYLVLGLSYSAFQVDRIEGRDEVGRQTSSFSNRDNAVALSAAGRIVGGVSLGATVRYLLSTLESDRAQGVGVDLGATYEPLPFLRIALSGQNILSYVWWSTGARDIVLPLAQAGVRGEILDGKLAAELDIIKPIRQPFDIAAGLEGTFLDMILCRAGLLSSIDPAAHDARYPDISLGLGFWYRVMGFDYAAVIPSSGLGLRHTLTIRGNIPGL